MENLFLTCCFDSVLIGTRSECDRLSCEHGKHSPEFEVYYHKVNNQYFYCLNWKQLGQYWQCVIKYRDTFCPDRCEKCSICKEMTDMFVELQDSCFFYPKTCPANNQENIPYQPVLWRVYNKIINKNSNKFYIEIAKSSPHHDLFLNYGQTRW